MLIIAKSTREFSEQTENLKPATVQETWGDEPLKRGDEAVYLVMPQTAEQVKKWEMLAFTYPEKTIIVQQFSEIGERWSKALK
jgi:hypothetical protein